MADVKQEETANGGSHSEAGEERAATRPDKVIVKEEQVDAMMEDSASAKANGDMNGGSDGYAKANGRDVKSEDSSIKSDAKVKQETGDDAPRSEEAGDGENKAKAKTERADKKTDDNEKKSEKSSSTKDKEKDKKKASRYSVSLSIFVLAEAERERGRRKERVRECE